MSDARSDIVGWAESQQGKPYQWGGTGPKGFDCSGLTSQSYKNGAGISIPRTAAEQQGASTKLPAGSLQPADLCFTGTPAYHVVMYVGSGQVVAADHSGTSVRTRAFNASEFTGGFGTFGVSGTGDTLIANVGFNPLGAVSPAFMGLEGAYNALTTLTNHLTDPVWWKRIVMGAIGIVIAAFALEFIHKGLSS